MTQEEKQLLLQDLCARLPYGVKVKFAIPTLLISVRNDRDGIKIITEGDYNEHVYNIEDIKPFLRPLSNMTEEEEKEYMNIDNRSYSCPMAYAHIPASDRIDWLNTHHFDYRGLIEKGLAIEVTDKNNPYKLYYE